MRVYRYKDDIRIISSWAVIYDNDFYYLLAYNGKAMRVYRIDHMEGVEIEEADAEGWRSSRKSSWLIIPSTPLACTVAR